MDAADRQGPEISQLRTERLKEKTAALKEQMRTMKVIEAELAQAPDGQISLTDPDARSMKTRGTGVVGYNVQTAVETRNHLIVEHEVTNTGSDRGQLSSMAKKACRAMGMNSVTAIADRGYYSGEEILKSDQAGIAAIVPNSATSDATAEGRFGKDDFIYDPFRDEYRCPAGEWLIYRFTSEERGMTLHRYWSSNCQSCAMKDRCTPSLQRRVTRWEHEDVLDEVQARLDRLPEAMRIRRSTVEHPFGTLKLWMGSADFLMKTLRHVKTEMSLHVLSYNMKRFFNIMTIPALMRTMRA